MVMTLCFLVFTLGIPALIFAVACLVNDNKARAKVKTEPKPKPYFSDSQLVELVSTMSVYQEGYAKKLDKEINRLRKKLVKAGVAHWETNDADGSASLTFEEVVG
jgi:uncharacterized protein YcbX